MPKRSGSASTRRNGSVRAAAQRPADDEAPGAARHVVQHQDREAAGGDAHPVDPADQPGAEEVVRREEAPERADDQARDPRQESGALEPVDRGRSGELRGIEGAGAADGFGCAHGLALFIPVSTAWRTSGGSSARRRSG